uniref:C-type lectin domain-containing protein n=1 Tax=Denticeps clupeoides TaxID=299321 RepID=A0AAY4DP32_9TELE
VAKMENMYENVVDLKTRRENEVEDALQLQRGKRPEERHLKLKAVWMSLTTVLLVALIVMCVLFYYLTQERDELIKEKLSKARFWGKLLRARTPGMRTFLYFGSSFYSISNEQKPWNESRAECRGRGADLVVINSLEEQEFIHNLTIRTWIGLTDNEQEGVWKWVDGSPLTEGYFHKNEPNGLKWENCVEIRHDWSDKSSNNWNDLLCNVSLIWICEQSELA